MLVVVCASAAESVGGSVAAVALADALAEMSRVRIGLACADPMGFFARIYADRDGQGRIAREQQGEFAFVDEPSGLFERFSGEKSIVVADWTGLGRLDLYRWPQTLDGFVRPGVHTVNVIVCSRSDGAQAWLLAAVMANPQRAARTMKLRFEPGAITAPEGLVAPSLNCETMRALDRIALAPRIAAHHRHLSMLDRKRIADWREQWKGIARTVITLAGPAQPALRKASTS
jgi:hypothetical protein